MRYLGWCLIAAFTLVTPGRATAQESRERWAPSISLGLEGSYREAAGKVQSTLITGVAGTPALPAAADERSDDGVFGVPVPFGVGLTAPATEWIPGRPRPFVEAAYQLTPGSHRTFLQQGNPGGTIAPPASPTSGGLGVKLKTKIENQWQASLGLAFDLDREDLPIQIRPSLSYLGQQMNFDATVVGLVSGTSTTVRLAPTASETFHYIGPRLGVEVGVGRRASFRFTVFADIAGYLLVGNGTAQGTATSGSDSASFRYEPDDLAIQAGVGTRVIWDPSGH